MQDLPNYATESMGNGPDGGLIAEAGQQTAEHNLKMSRSWRLQRARLGSELDAGIYYLWLSDCYGSAPCFVPCQDGFPSRQLRRRNGDT